MSDDLDWILSRYRSEPFEWGVLDCMIGPADFVWKRTGIDGAAHLRGQYHDAKSCNRLTGYLKNPLGVFDDCVQRVGLEPTRQPLKTSIGLIDTSLHERPLGGICIGQHWALMGEIGLIITEALHVRKAWLVP